MKNSMKKIVTMLLVFLMLLSAVACQQNEGEKSLWDNAKYNADTTLGEGAKTLIVKVQAEDKTVTFTINTDKETVGAALLEHSLVAGEESEYGLYIKEVNGIKADYDTDGAYWGFFQNGEYMMTGADATNFESGQSYEFVYTKG